MRKIHKERLRGILAVLLILATFATAYYWENYGRQEFTYSTIVVFKDEVQANTVVKRNMLGLMKVESKTLIDDAVTNPENIIGKETVNYVPAKLPLTNKFFTEADLSTGEGRYTFKIPESWIYSFPQTLRRGDKIFIYAIKSEKKGASDVNDEEYEIVETDGMQKIDEVGKALTKEKPIFDTKVVYVKDSANREVLNVGDNRYDGTSTVAQIEIILTEELYNKLCEVHDAGYMFNILYE